MGFTTLATSAIVGKLSTRSLALGTIVLVPNSLGPAELLALYGTPEQKSYYLPRLARGEIIPCFALTEPEAGSDAAAMRSRGVVFRDERGELRIRLQFSKRYITLAPMADLIGLAVKLEDPERLLGGGPDVGITCVLVPATTPGVSLGRRHDPMGVAFPNGPVEGRDVVVGIDAIIGGRAYAGKGWSMLMEALSAGRGVFLPAQSAAGLKLLARAVGAYAAVRQQFGMPIGRFEGIEEPLARLAVWAYLGDAARVLTCGAIDAGHKPSVVSAIMKLRQTELLRQAASDGMDVLGGAGICKGPRNLTAHGYVSAPIGITVEGANILTRTLIVYGQGAIRCHPYAQKEIEALAKGDGRAFVRAFLGHTVFLLGSVARAALLGLTRGLVAHSPVAGAAAPFYRRLAWASASFALVSDLAMAANGSRLKQKGKLTGRLADWLSWMYIAAAALRRFEAEGRPQEDETLLRAALETCFAHMQQARAGLLANLEVPFLTWLLRGPWALWARMNPLGVGPSDADGGAVARILLGPSAQRDRLTEGAYAPADPGDPLARLERAFTLAAEAAPVLDRIRQAIRKRVLAKDDPEALVGPAVAASVVSAQEADLVRAAAAARLEAIQVDSFSAEEYFGRSRGAAAAEPAGATLAAR
jgi:acyl-CoA dehydrogenase